MAQYVAAKYENGKTWLPLVDYAFKKGVSLSTLRRYIKSGKVQHQLTHGRYLILDDGESILDGHAEIENLKSQLQNAKEEIAELKMLVALYEEKFNPRLTR